MEKQSMDTKKGFCAIFNWSNPDGWKNMIAKFNVGWVYTWGDNINFNYLPEGVEFVPMMWQEWPDKEPWGPAESSLITRGVLDHINSLYDQGLIKNVLGFNEPDEVTQANVPYWRAIAVWPYISDAFAGRVGIGSLATVNPDNWYMKTFMDGIRDNGSTVDFVCVHWYGGANASSFKSKMNEVYALYGKPIWVTEFCPADWSAGSKETANYTPAQALAFMQDVLPWMKETPWMERFSWYSDPGSAALGNSALTESDWTTLTPLGEYYRDFI